MDDAAMTPDETWVMVIGRANGINTGFTSAIEAAGWRWREVAALPDLLGVPLPPRTVIALRVVTFTVAAYTAVRHLAGTVGVPVVVFSHERHPSIVRATLQAGADDYIAVPVTVEEMIARLGAVVRVRFGVQASHRASDYRLDDSSQSVTIADGPPVRLSLSEYRLFRALLTARNRPVPRERLLALPLTPVESDGQNALDATVCRLRRKLGAGRVVTVRGMGYQLIDIRYTVADDAYERNLLIASSE